MPSCGVRLSVSLSLSLSLSLSPSHSCILAKRINTSSHFFTIFYPTDLVHHTKHYGNIATGTLTEAKIAIYGFGIVHFWTVECHQNFDGAVYRVFQKKVAPPKTFWNIFTLVKSFCVKFCSFVGNSYPHTSTNFRTFISIFHQMALGLIFPRVPIVFTLSSFE